MLAVVKFVFLMHLCMYSTVFIDSLSLCVCVCTYATPLYVVCVAPPSSSPAVLGCWVWPGVHAVGVREWLHCLPPLAPRCTGRGLLQTLTAVSHTTCLSNVCGIVIITDTTALTCYSTLRIYTTLCVFCIIPTVLTHVYMYVHGWSNYIEVTGNFMI